MKKVLLFIALISFTVTQSQIVNIPDVNFKNALLNHDPIIDTNNDGEIQVAEANSFSNSINVSSQNIIDLTGIEEFTSIYGLDCSQNQITSLDLSNLHYLYSINCSNNSISSLNIYHDTFSNYLNLNCSNNLLTSLDLSNLGYDDIFIDNNINCSNNNLTYLNLENSFIGSLGCSNNNLTTLNLGNANIGYLYCEYNNLSNFITENATLEALDCSYNNLTELVINEVFQGDHPTIECTHNNELNSLTIENTTISQIICSTNTNLTTININNSNLTTAVFLNNYNISNLNINNSNFNRLALRINLASISFNDTVSINNFDCFGSEYVVNIDLSNLHTLTDYSLENNPNLTYINLKNGNNNELWNTTEYTLSNLPNLETICIDDINSEYAADINSNIDFPVTLTEYCSLEPALSNQIVGSIKFDANDNGCDSLDLSISNLLILTDNGSENSSTFTDSLGNFKIFTNEGNFNTTVPNLPSYFTVTPNEQTSSFSGFDNSFTADFCIAPNQVINDVNIALLSIIPARPGFNATYQMAYKNVGTTQLNGNITLEFDETKLSFSNASETIGSQTSNSLTFDYSNLNPFETRTVDLEFNVSAPPTTEIDDILNFTTTINPIASDYTTDDNIFELNQTVVGSYDPNDITCLEGNQVLFANKDKYLHYIIRFQNTGTASAINVVVKNILDNHLDWSTLQLENLSHNNRVAIKNGNEIEFIFENIDLPDSTTDEPNSHGFIAYKIKPKADIALDDIILNKADIFFDYNSPIETNTTSTRIVDVLAINKNTLLDFSVYPTPTENILNIKSKTEISKIEIYSKLGQLILKNETENNIDISNLTNGLYFVKVEDINGNFGVKKIMKK